MLSWALFPCRALPPTVVSFSGHPAAHPPKRAAARYPDQPFMDFRSTSHRCRRHPATHLAVLQRPSHHRSGVHSTCLRRCTVETTLRPPTRPAAALMPKHHHRCVLKPHETPTAPNEPSHRSVPSRLPSHRSDQARMLPHNPIDGVPEHNADRPADAELPTLLGFVTSKIAWGPLPKPLRPVREFSVPAPDSRCRLPWLHGAARRDPMDRKGAPDIEYLCPWEPSWPVGNSDPAYGKLLGPRGHAPLNPI